MMLFLDDLPLQLGAYYPVGTNNLVLNRALVEIVEASVTNKPTVNALVYNLLLHEYLHALGEMSEMEVRRLVVEVAKKSFGEQYIATVVARKSPWVLLKDIPLGPMNAPKRVMEIVRDFEKTDSDTSYKMRIKGKKKGCWLLVVFHPDFKVRLWVSACWAFVGHFCSFENVAAVSAFPLNRRILLEHFAVLHIR